LREVSGEARSHVPDPAFDPLLGRTGGGTVQRVDFPPGDNSAVLEGEVIRGERDRYLLDARADQRMTVHISSLEDNAVFQIYEPGLEQTLDDAGEGDDTTD
jgi:hypothetical protein